MEISAGRRNCAFEKGIMDNSVFRPSSVVEFLGSARVCPYFLLKSPIATPDFD
jgi:hypothetical protein